MFALQLAGLGSGCTCISSVLHVEPFRTHIAMGHSYGLVQFMRSKFSATEGVSLDGRDTGEEKEREIEGSRGRDRMEEGRGRGRGSGRMERKNESGEEREG